MVSVWPKRGFRYQPCPQAAEIFPGGVLHKHIPEYLVHLSERFKDGRIKLLRLAAGATASNDVQGHPMAEREFACPFASKCVADVAAMRDPGGHGNCLSLFAIRITPAVPVRRVVERDIGIRLEIARLTAAEDYCASCGVLFCDLPFTWTWPRWRRRNMLAHGIDAVTRLGATHGE